MCLHFENEKRQQNSTYDWAQLKITVFERSLLIRFFNNRQCSLKQIRCKFNCKLLVH